MLLCANPFKVIGGVLGAVTNIVTAPLRLLSGQPAFNYQPPRVVMPEIKIPEMPTAKPPAPNANKTASSLSEPASRKNKTTLLAQGTAKLRNDLTSSYASSKSGINIPY